MTFTIYPFFTLKNYEIIKSTPIIKKYEMHKINEKYFNDIDYLKKDINYKILNNQIYKNDYLRIEYLNKKYPEDNDFEKMNRIIPYKKKKI